MPRPVTAVDSAGGASPVSTSGISPRLPIALRVRRVVGLSELMAFAVHNKNHAHRHERGREDENQNPAAQGLNHSSTGGGCLRIAERATLGEGRERSGEHGQYNQRNGNAAETVSQPSAFVF